MCLKTGFKGDLNEIVETAALPLSAGVSLPALMRQAGKEGKG